MVAEMPQQRSARPRRDPFDRPLDRALQQLRGHRLSYRWTDDPRVWLALCPACLAPKWCLRIREAVKGGPISLICSGGRCSDAEIRAALEREPVHPAIEAAEERAAATLDLAEQASDLAAQALELAARVIGPELKAPA